MVYIFLANGFEEVEAITVADMLRRADIQIKTVSIMEDRLTYGAHGIGVEADCKFMDQEYDRASMLILPGGMPGTMNLCNYKPLNDEVKAFYESGRPVAAICAAPMVFGRLGILKGHKATIYEGMEEHIADAEHVNERVCVSGNIITSKGPATAIDFSLAIIEYLSGKEKADEIAAEILYR